MGCDTQLSRTQIGIENVWGIARGNVGGGKLSERMSGRISGEGPIRMQDYVQWLCVPSWLTYRHTDKQTAFDRLCYYKLSHLSFKKTYSNYILK